MSAAAQFTPAPNPATMPDRAPALEPTPMPDAIPTPGRAPAGRADPRLVAWRDIVALACVEMLRRYQSAWSHPGLDEAGRAAAAIGVMDPHTSASLPVLPDEGELAALVRHTGITEADEAILATAWWASVDPQVAALFGAVHDDASRRHATLGLLAQVLAPLGLRLPMHIGEDHPLVAGGLIEPVPDPATSLHLPSATVAILAGDRRAAPEPDAVEDRLAAVAHQIEALLATGAHVLVRCAVADDKAALRDAVAHLAGIAVAPVVRPPAVANLLHTLGHELPAVVLDDDAPPPAGTVLALGGPTSAAPAGWHTIDVAPPTLTQASRVWREELLRVGLRPDDPAVAELAGRLPLNSLAIGEIVDVAASTAAALGRPTRLADVRTALRAHPRHDPGGLARRFTASASLDQLVLPPATRAALDDFLAHARWSPAAHASLGLTGQRGRAVIALFHGPSGTGKTAVAEAAAATLDRDLWVVDLARVVSKWLGETQRNLDAVLSRAATAGALLLFDEADGLFGKRGEVTDARDRYANLEIDHLLQRIELHEGVVVLTSNRPGALDDAFARRIRLSVRFDMPDYDSRLEIWRRYLPERMLENGTSCDGVAREELSGASIRAAALAAAVSAIAAGTSVREVHLVTAVRRELEKGRRPPTARPDRRAR